MQSHADPRLDRPWKLTQLGLLTLAMMPIMGALLLVASSALVTRRRWSVIKGRSINRALGLLSLLLMGSCAMAHLPGEAWLGLVHLLPYFWLMAAQAELIASPTQLRQAAILVALPVLPLVLIGFGELYLGWSSPPALASILPWPPTAGGTPQGRMASVFGYANNLALYLNIALALLMGLWGHDCWAKNKVAEAIHIDAITTRASALSTESWLHDWPRSRRLLLWSLLISLCLAGLFLTQSRSAWGIAILSGLATALYWGWTWLASAVLGFTGAILWSAFGPFGKETMRQIVPELIWARLTDQNFSNRPVETLRITQWKFVLGLSESRPLQGWGLRNFSHLYQEQMGIWMGHPHNLFLMLGAETGWFITGGLLGLVGWIFYRGIEVVWLKSHIDMVDCHLFFGVLIAFASTTSFHLFDVPLFDFRINALGWWTISQILGVVYLSDAGNLNLGRTDQSSTD